MSWGVCFWCRWRPWRGPVRLVLEDSLRHHNGPKVFGLGGYHLDTTRPDAAPCKGSSARGPLGWTTRPS